MRNKTEEDKKKAQPGNDQLTSYLPILIFFALFLLFLLGYEHLNEPLHVVISVHLPEKEADYCLRY